LDRKRYPELKSAAIITFFVFTISACYYDNEEDLYRNFPQNCETTSLTYTNDIKEIIDDRCVTCHQPGGIAATWPLTTYEEVKAQEAGVVDRINRPFGDGEIMPPGGNMSNCKIDKINAWYLDGAPQ
jgi:uncharacterized membrane protein